MSTREKFPFSTQDPHLAEKLKYINPEEKDITPNEGVEGVEKVEKPASEDDGSTGYTVPPSRPKSPPPRSKGFF